MCRFKQVEFNQVQHLQVKFDAFNWKLLLYHISLKEVSRYIFLIDSKDLAFDI